jgi:hypothetical protein
MMGRKQFDPLSFIPSSLTIKQKLDETERLARRLRILLETAQMIETAGEQNTADVPAAPTGGVGRAN